MSAHAASALRFVAVGCVAAAVHFALVRLLVDGAQFAPLAANLPAWCIAFCVSYFGHRRWTFRAHDAPLARSMLRFAAVSLAGLALNEGAYAALLRFTPLRYDVALLMVLAAVALFTWWLGRHWAFAGTRPAP